MHVCIFCLIQSVNFGKKNIWRSKFETSFSTFWKCTEITKSKWNFDFFTSVIPKCHHLQNYWQLLKSLSRMKKSTELSNFTMVSEFSSLLTHELDWKIWLPIQTRMLTKTWDLRLFNRITLSHHKSDNYNQMILWMTFLYTVETSTFSMPS